MKRWIMSPLGRIAVLVVSNGSIERGRGVFGDFVEAWALWPMQEGRPGVQNLELSGGSLLRTGARPGGA
ncbi:hypothetical protein SAMN00790413_04506 [Deinococcus hopiensis KR-140]|uniref:Uncharacterized protein n=1 Tax=Deinococcus hopiensis KR-140 TaxID=695939 RepID=A0A1W1UJK6_9DEIO|nr:hypothetical protein SAMN00790413_04506 [Deinococcus hopiensis KR-140]